MTAVPLQLWLLLQILATSKKVSSSSHKPHLKLSFSKLCLLQSCYTITTQIQTQHQKKKKKHHLITPLQNHTKQNKVPHRHTTHQKLIYINFSLFFFYRQLRRLENRETKQRDQTTHKEKQKRGERKKKHDKCPQHVKQPPQKPHQQKKDTLKKKEKKKRVERFGSPRQYI